MKNNTDLVEIVYSKTIEEYVIIIKRFPNKFIVINEDTFRQIQYLCEECKAGEYHCITILNPDKERNSTNTYNRLQLYSNNDQDSCIHTVSRTLFKSIEIVEITNLEKFEIINKVLELREILIERGE